MSLAPAFHESLPYIDPQPSSEALAAAKALIAAEAATNPPPAPAQESQPSFSPLITTELDRIAASSALTPLDTTRYEAQELPPASSSSAAALEPILSKLYTSSAYLSARLENLKLLEKHGANAWLLSNYTLEAELKAIEKELADTKRQIDEVNASRARRQTDVKGEVLALEETWRTGVGKVLETEIAVEELRAQIREELRKRSAQT